MSQKNKYLIRQFCLLAVTFLFSMGLFLLSYRYDNKYTVRTAQPVDGILFYGPDGREPVYLINGWEYYRGRLLTPEDFTGTLPHLNGHLAIGQYPGMEAGDPSAPPHGSITYRLTLCLPETPAPYTLELPEIYSAYRLYIDGRLMASRGNPEAAAYTPSLRSGSLTFEASGDVTLLLSVSDWSHLYSGLVYPPAFGSPDTVLPLLDQKFAWALSVTILALILGFFQLALSVLLKSRRSLLSGLICAAFAVSVCSPAFHRLATTGIIPFYSLEIFCRYAIYGLSVLLVNDLCGRRPSVSTAAAVPALCFPFAALAVSLLASQLSYRGMVLFSHASGGYKVLCTAWLLGSALLDSRDGHMEEPAVSLQNRPILLAGICIFASSLAADRWFPDFEPIRFGWFSETAGLLFVLILSFLLLRDSAVLYRRQSLLVQQKKQLAEQIRLQKKHYSELAAQMEAIRVMRHDIRHHLTQLSALLSEGNTEAANAFLSRLNHSSLSAAPLSFCDAYFVDVLLRYYYAKAEEQGIPLRIEAKLPSQPGIPEEDLCVILGNLLENALEACEAVPPARRFLSVVLSCQNGGLAVETRNSYTGLLEPDGKNFYSSREKNRHGIGLSSVRSTAEKYEGNVWIRTEPGDDGIHTFIAQVLLITGQELTQP